MLTHGVVLIGAFDSEEAAATFLRPLVSCDSAVEDLLSRWAEARRAFLDAPDAGDVPALEPDPQARAAVERRLERSLYRESLADKRWSIEDVRLDSLVVFQPMVIRERVDAFGSRCTDDLLDTLFPLSTELDVGMRAAEGPGVTLVSSRGELAVSGVCVRRDGGGALEVVVRIEPRPNYASALRAGDRLLLRNGYHRLCAAWRAGVRTAPLVVIEGDFDGLTARMRAGFSAALLRDARPPRLSDLTDGGSTITVVLRTRRYETTVRAARNVVYEDDGSAVVQRSNDLNATTHSED